jgi:hypothetical protein
MKCFNPRRPVRVWPPAANFCPRVGSPNRLKHGAGPGVGLFREFFSDRNRLAASDFVGAGNESGAVQFRSAWGLPSRGTRPLLEPKGRARMDRMNGRKRRLIFVALLTLLPAFSTIGCGVKRGYPTVKPATASGRSGECAYCHKKIERVERANLVTLDGKEYIVCDEKCAESLRDVPDR